MLYRTLTICLPLTLLFAGGCADQRSAEIRPTETALERELEPTSKPEPRPVGTRFTAVHRTASGTVEERGRVAAIDGSRVTYETLEGESPGCRYTKDRERGDWLTMNHIAWENCAQGSGRLRIESKKGQLWPMKKGNTVAYEATVISHDGQPRTRRWQCTVADTLQVTVEAGTYATYKVACERASTTTIYYFAPAFSDYGGQVVALWQPANSNTEQSAWAWELIEITKPGEGSA